MQKLIYLVGIVLVIGFVSLGVREVTQNREQIEMREIQLQTREAELKEIRLEFEQLNIELDKQLNKSNQDKDKIEQLKQDKSELEQRTKQLERDLQARRQKQRKEQERLANVAQRASGTQTAQAQGTGSCESYRHLIAQYSWNVETMMRAMRLESGCNPNAVGDQYVINGVYAPSCGLLQVRTLPGRPSCEQLKDPAFNIATAYQIWKGQGYRAWSVLH
jgi:predicted nuclease with TOPRIM domain